MRELPDPVQLRSLGDGSPAAAARERPLAIPHPVEELTGEGVVLATLQNVPPKKGLLPRVGVDARVTPGWMPRVSCPRTIEDKHAMLIQFVDTPYAVTYSASGEAYVQWPGASNVLSLVGYTQVSMEVARTANTRSFDVLMGKISGATLASRVATDQPADMKIHTYRVVGPDMGLVLRGTPNTTDHVQLWVHLSQAAALGGPVSVRVDSITVEPDHSGTVSVTAAPVAPSGLRTVQGWENLFLASWESENTNTYLPLSTSGNSSNYYNLAYGIDGLTAMFEATANTKYLDRALLYVRNVISSAKVSSSLPNSQFKDGYLAWAAWNHPTDPSIAGSEYPLYESYCWRYVTKLLRAMRQNPTVYADPVYRQTYDDVLSFTRVNIFEKWLQRGIENLYRSRTHMAAHWAFIAVDLWVLVEDPIARATYRTVLDNINLHLPNYSSSLRQQIKINSANPAAYFWNDIWTSAAPPGQDVSHGNGVLAYIVEAHDLGVEWGDADIRAFSRTLLDLVWVPNSTGYTYAMYVDGSGTGNGWFNDGFCKLGRYDATIQKRLEGDAVGRGMQLYGNGALNAKILDRMNAIAEDKHGMWIQFVDTPYAVTYSASGEAFVQWPGGSNVLSLVGYAQVSVEVAGTANTRSFNVLMGKISGATLASRVAADQPADMKIHTYPVVGPELGLVLRGTPNTTDRVQLWVYLGQAAALGGPVSVRVDSTPVDIVLGGQARAVVLVPANASHEAASELAAYVEKSTGATLPVMTEAQLQASGSQYDGHARVYVGFVGAESDPNIPNAMVGLDGDGFVIRTYNNTLTIIGPTADGTRFGVSEFLERFVGVRWLMPGTIGEDVPSRSDLSLTSTDIVVAPVYTSRMVSGVTTGPGAGDKTAWLKRNRIHGRISFHHNLHTMFPPSKYATTHPEYYPMGKPPGDKVTTGWQPSFSQPGTIDVAVQYILDYFAQPKNAGVTSFSLGINDGSGGFSKSDLSDPPEINSQGYVSASVVYYAWVNEVVSRVVAAGHDDKTFGLLAYTNVADPPPPPFALDKHVVPFYTRDRYGWVDATYEQKEHASLAAWKAAASRVGWYDYIYGSPYAVPRVYPHQMAETYAYGAAQDVVAAYAEMYPNWGEGPKPWLFLKLLWDPNQNVDTLLDEWYTRAVGAQAAPYLNQYYRAWENFWIQTVPGTGWFESGRSTPYFPFSKPSYLASVSPALITQTSDLMASVVANAANATSAQKQRAAKLNEAHSYYRASAQSYPRARPTTSATAIAVLDGLASGLAAYEERQSLLQQFETDPLLYQHLKVTAWPPAWHPSQLWGVVDYCRMNEPTGGTVTNRLQADSTGAPEQAVRDFSRLALQLISGAATQLLANSSFETASGSTGPENWGLWVASAGTLRRTTSKAHTGTASVVAHLLTRGGPAHLFTPVIPGLLATRAYVLAPSGNQWHGTVQFALNLNDANNGKLFGETTPVAGLAGQWAAVDGLFDIPAAMNGKPVVTAQVVLILNGFTGDADIYVDDLTAYQAT